MKHAMMSIGSEAKYIEIARTAGQQSILSWPRGLATLLTMV